MGPRKRALKLLQAALGGARARAGRASGRASCHVRHVHAGRARWRAGGRAGGRFRRARARAVEIVQIYQWRAGGGSASSLARSIARLRCLARAPSTADTRARARRPTQGKNVS